MFDEMAVRKSQNHSCLNAFHQEIKRITPGLQLQTPFYSTAVTKSNAFDGLPASESRDVVVC